MAEARNGAESSAPAVEMDAVSMNRRRVNRNKKPSFRKGSSFAATALWLGSAGWLNLRTAVSPSTSPPKRAYVPLFAAD
jgi:hypothetical protein